MPTHDMWCHNVTSYGKVDWRSSQRQHPAGSRVPRCPSQADAAARRAKNTRSRHFKPLATSSEPICVAKPQVKALRILVYSPKRKASAYFACFLHGKLELRQAMRDRMPASSSRNALFVYVPASHSCANALQGRVRWRRHQLTCSCTLHQPTRASNARPYVHLQGCLPRCGKPNPKVATKKPLDEELRD